MPCFSLLFATTFAAISFQMCWHILSLSTAVYIVKCNVLKWSSIRSEEYSLGFVFSGLNGLEAKAINYSI